MARVLVVEDDLDQLAIRRQLLEHAGYEISTAQTAAEGLPRLPGCQVVLMDLHIPRLEDGLRLIRSATATRARVIVLSGAQVDTPQGVDEFLVKPCSTKKLLEAIARLCSSAQNA
ncbi:MAG TPA: response regulator [Bryobacteraceae bacterium]|nr:response regulator [Bryobacteraceae bacterium]